MEKYSFQTFGRSNQPAETYAGKARGDELALIYADYVARLLEGRSTGARVAREVSDSSLAVGGAFLAATETLEISAETVAGIGVGMVIIRELQKIFNAGGRSEAFADAAYLIRQAQSEYRQFNPNPSPDVLTENGAILVSRVDAAVHAARKSMNGRLPGLLDLQQATQPMTKKGADRESSGTPQTMFTASGVRELPQLQPPAPPGPGVPVPQRAMPEDVLVKQGEVQVSIDALTGTELPVATVTVMDRLDPPTTSPEGNQTTKYPRNKTGLRRLVGKTRKIEDLNAIQASL